MRTTVKGKNLEIAEEDRQYAQQKMRRLERLLDDRTDALVEFSVEHHRDLADTHVVDVHLVIDGRLVRGVARAESFHAALDAVVDRLERRAVVHKEKPRVRSRPAEEKELLRSIADGTPDDARRAAAVVKVKRFAIEPMFEEDAVSRMQELGHDFFVFVNAETERVAVLYRRRDGDYGLIEPAIGGHYTKGRG